MKRKMSRDQLKAMFARMAEGIKEAPKHAAEHVHTFGKQLKAVTSYHKQQAHELARHLPVESLAAKAVDLPFVWLEGITGHHIDKRVQRLEKLAASQIQALQEHLTGRVATRARRLHSRLFTGAVAQPLSAGEPRTKLRRTADEIKWDRALSGFMHQAVTHGHSGEPTDQEVDQHLMQHRIQLTHHNRQQFRRMVRESRLFGTHFALRHYFG